MKIDILTLFPEMFKGPFEESIIKRAQEKGLVEIKIHNLRDWAKDKRGTVDDKPYGGGVGMVLKIDPIYESLKSLDAISFPQPTKQNGTNYAPAKIVPKLGQGKQQKLQKQKIILLSPCGKLFNQRIASELAKLERLILICGHYEGVDQRVSDYLVDEEISIGDYVLTGGEIPTMVIIDAVTRLIPGVLEKKQATEKESFCINDSNHDNKKLLEYPQYTRPEKYKNWRVPKILLSGDHKKIEEWRRQESLKKTKKVRPDLLL